MQIKGLILAGVLLATNAYSSGVITGKVTGFVNSPIHEQSKQNVCFLEADMDLGKPYVFVIDSETCTKQKNYYSGLIGKAIQVSRSSYSKITNNDLIENYREALPDGFFVQMKSKAKISLSKPARAKVVDVLSKQYPEAKGVQPFGDNPVCILKLELDYKNKTALVMPQERCESEGLTAAKGKTIEFLREDAVYFNSSYSKSAGSFITALKSIDSAYFYKLYRDEAAPVLIK